MMRLIFGFFVIFILILIGSCTQAEDRPILDIPIYAGGEVMMEVNLTNEDILPMVNAMMPLLGRKFGEIVETVSTEDIAGVFKDVKSIQFIQFDLSKPSITDRDIADFYTKNVPNGSWSRVFWKSDTLKGTIAVYCRSGCDMIYGFRIRSIKESQKTIKRVEVFKTEGKLDYVKLISLVAKYATSATLSAKSQ